MDTFSAELFRIDPLTGCNNFLGFIERLEQLSLQETEHSFSILYIDMNELQRLNETRGHVYGDSAIRWVVIVLREECKAPIYRFRGDSFAVILGNANQDPEITVKRILTRMNKEAEPLGLPIPPVKIALVYYDANSDISPANVFVHMAIIDIKLKKERSFNVFREQDINRELSRYQKTDDSSAQTTMFWIANLATRRILSMGRTIDEIHQAAYTDSISGLPNIRAALLYLEETINTTSTSNSFSILLIDGDDLRSYNDISYAVGDEMIRDLSTVLNDNLRPDDFIARWRSGDEFIAVLPNTTSEGANVVGERFCRSVKETSQAWQFPISISIGIATYPTHGNTIDTLVDKAELALKLAKNEGKDRIVIVD
jgi:diguanylate cyclase (GGDEF)-like protein